MEEAWGEVSPDIKELQIFGKKLINRGPALLITSLDGVLRLNTKVFKNWRIG